MRHYELMVILDPDLEERTIAPSLDQFLGVVRQGGGSVDKIDIWGRRRLAYEIDHKADGSYHLLTFSADAATLDEVSRILKITDGVMRHLAVRRPKPGRTTSASSGPPRDGDREPEYAASSTEPDERE